jgi:hypothetical protein
MQRQGTLRIRDNPYFYTMPVRRKIDNNSGIYFITFTCLDWLPIFEICKGYNSVYKWFDVLKNKAHYIVGYTIMPNHLHAIIAFRNTGKSINSIIANGKRFIAYELVYALIMMQSKSILLLKRCILAIPMLAGVHYFVIKVF